MRLILAIFKHEAKHEARLAFLGKHLSMYEAQNNTFIYDFISILHAIFIYFFIFVSHFSNLNINFLVPGIFPAPELF